MTAVESRHDALEASSALASTSPDGKRRQEQVPSDGLANKRVKIGTYVDHANDPLVTEYSPATSGTFPFILHTLLNEVHDIGLSNIVSWIPHGRAFLVRDADAFVEHVMKLYFKQSQMTSFIRQLNLYGFKRLNSGHDSGGYYHEYFLRDRIDLCVHIHRTKVKGGTSPSLPMQEPDFYAMPPVGVCKEVAEQSDLNEENEIAASEGRTISTAGSVEDQSETSVTSPEEFAPRPLPPVFDGAPISSAISSTNIVDVGKERWVFHVSASRISQEYESASTLNSSLNVANAETESKSTDDSLFSEEGLNAGPSEQSIESQGLSSEGSDVHPNGDCHEDSLLQPSEGQFEEDLAWQQSDEETQDTVSPSMGLDWD